MGNPNYGISNNMNNPQVVNESGDNKGTVNKNNELQGGTQN